MLLCLCCIDRSEVKVTSLIMCTPNVRNILLDLKAKVAAKEFLSTFQVIDY